MGWGLGNMVAAAWENKVISGVGGRSQSPGLAQVMGNAEKF